MLLYLVVSVQLKPYILILRPHINDDYLAPTRLLQQIGAAFEASAAVITLVILVPSS